MVAKDAFWHNTPLAQMNEQQWESLCDGCGKCCLHKLEDDETGQVYYTNVTCRLLNQKTIQCDNYANRFKFVPDCLNLTKDNLDDLSWLPESCSYVLVAKGKPLPKWHHLITGDKNSIHQAGASIKGKTIDEREAGDLQDHIVKLEDL